MVGCTVDVRNEEDLGRVGDMGDLLGHVRVEGGKVGRVWSLQFTYVHSRIRSI